MCPSTGTTAHDVHDGRPGGSMGELGVFSSSFMYSTVWFNSETVYSLPAVAVVVVYAN
jgi:hypothetical protein